MWIQFSGPVEARGERVGDAHELAGVLRLDEVAVLLVAVAEVVAELDLARDLATQAQQPLEHAGAHVVEPHVHGALEHRELEPRVPLDRELVGWDRRQDLVDLRGHAALVERLEARLVLDRHERADRRQRRRQRDEEPA
jgi:hypothetical protein